MNSRLKGKLGHVVKKSRLSFDENVTLNFSCHCHSYVLSVATSKQYLY